MKDQRIISTNRIAVLVSRGFEKTPNVANKLLDTYDKLILIDNNWDTLGQSVKLVDSQNKRDKLIPIKANLDSGSDVAKLACLIHYKFGGTSMQISFLEEEDQSMESLQNALIGLKLKRQN